MVNPGYGANNYMLSNNKVRVWGENMPTAIYQHVSNMQRVKLTRRVRMQRVNWVSWYADQEERMLTGCVRMQTKSKEGLTVYVRLHRVNCVSSYAKG